MIIDEQVQGDWQILIGDFGDPVEGKLHFADGVVEATGFWNSKGTYELVGPALSVKLGRKSIAMGAISDGFFSGYYSSKGIDVNVAIRRM